MYCNTLPEKVGNGERCALY